MLFAIAFILIASLVMSSMVVLAGEKNKDNVNTDATAQAADANEPVIEHRIYTT